MKSHVFLVKDKIKFKMKTECNVTELDLKVIDHYYDVILTK